MCLYQVVLTPVPEDGGYVVTVPNLPGCITEGDTMEEALANAKEAISLYLEGERIDCVQTSIVATVEIERERSTTNQYEDEQERSVKKAEWLAAHKLRVQHNNVLTDDDVRLGTLQSKYAGRNFPVWPEPDTVLFLLRLLDERDKYIDQLELEKEEWQEISDDDDWVQDITQAALNKEKQGRRDVSEMLLAVQHVLAHPDEHREQGVDPVAYARKKVIEALDWLDEVD